MRGPLLLSPQPPFMNASCISGLLGLDIPLTPLLSCSLLPFQASAQALLWSGLGYNWSPDTLSFVYLPLPLIKGKGIQGIGLPNKKLNRPVFSHKPFHPG